ncbi:unnamed protein product [Enterobius vermicularis]|uniref:Glycosyltransferase family 92 protein n=1 Tax=Enterobius vermicularis TaxID=51028 RepID=A0A0N4VF90_ENTVE|nr:unnamed protein product [Enterobius vermicularis]
MLYNLNFIRCTYEGKYGTADYARPIQTSLVLNRTLKLYVFLKTEPKRKKVLEIIDLRVSQEERKAHRLAVCAGPVWLYANWASLPFFFETRITNGATKFYFYVNSITKEVDGIFRLYENDPTISLERILWNQFPTEADVPDEENPNNLIQVGAQVFVFNDCILRATGNTDYLALSDLDENFVAFDNRTLLSTLDSQLEKNKNIASIMFQSTYGELIVVVIPERILSQGVHETMKVIKPFKKIVMNPNISQVYHIRERVPVWNSRYLKRLEQENLRLKNYSNPGYLTLKRVYWKNVGLKVIAFWKLKIILKCLFYAVKLFFV